MYGFSRRKEIFHLQILIEFFKKEKKRNTLHVISNVATPFFKIYNDVLLNCICMTLCIAYIYMYI